MNSREALRRADPARRLPPERLGEGADQLLQQILAPSRPAVHHAEDNSAQHQQRRARGPLVLTAFVAAVVVIGTMFAIHLGSDQRQIEPVGATSSSATSALPTADVPAGKLLGTFTSADGPVQKHTIRPGGLAIASVFACTGEGSYLVSIAHDGESGGDGGCAGQGASSGNKGVAGSTTVTIHTQPSMRWTLTIVGIPETYVTPRPVTTPTTTAGTAARFCSATDLSARFEPTKAPSGVTEVNVGQIVLSNTSPSECALAGYPMVRFLDHGRTLGHHTMNAIDDRSSTEKGLKPVLLAPGASAYTQIDWYLPNYYPENDQGPCEARAVSTLRIDLANKLANSAQRGSLTMPIGSTVSACLNGPWGVDGKYGQISSTVFVDYSLTDLR